MTRIIAGRARGKRLQVPPGDRVRPTGDRVRESLFNVLTHRLGVRWPGLRVLDLFAGAGTLGLEALSRGAESGVFVEKAPRVARVLARNLEAFPEAARLVRAPVERFLAGSPTPFDVVFLDPPYAAGLVDPTLSALCGGGSWLAPGALIIVERPATAQPLDPPSGTEVAFDRVYGAAGVVVLARTDAQ